MELIHAHFPHINALADSDENLRSTFTQTMESFVDSQSPFINSMGLFMASMWRTHLIHGVAYDPRMPKAMTFNADALRFGAIVRRLREQRGWTIRKLAQRAGLSPNYVGIVERGANVPSLSTVIELVEVLNGDIAAVMGELTAARNTR